jgi:hypothetical protein
MRRRVKERYIIVRGVEMPIRCEILQVDHRRVIRSFQVYQYSSGKVSGVR